MGMTEFQKDPNQGKTDQAKQEAAQLGETAKQQAAEVKDTAVNATQQVADTAKAEATQVVGEARDQIRGLLDQTMGEVRGRAAEGQGAIANSVRSLTSELGQMANESSASGPAAQLVGELANRGEQLSSWLENSEPADLLDEARRFAARRPGTFLAIAAGAGLLVGRLARGTREVVADEKEQVAPTQFATYPPTTSPYAPHHPEAGRLPGMAVPSEYDETGYPVNPPRYQQNDPFRPEGL